MKSTYINILTHKCAVWLLLAVLCVGVTGCQKKLEPIIAKGEPAYISLSTKALNPGVAGNQINTVRVILINPATDLIELNEFVDSLAAPLIIPVKTGTYNVYVVANEEADGSENTALNNVYDLSSLRDVSLMYSAALRDLTNVPMIGEVKNVTITAPASGVSPSDNLASVSTNGVNHGTTLPVELDRMASKVSIKIISVNKSLTSASLKQVPTSIPLFGDAFLSNVITQTEIITTNLFILTASATDKAGHILECKDILIPSCMFTDVTNEANAMLFEFATPTGETFSTELGHTLSGATKDYTIKRNHNYTLTIRIINNTITTTSLVEAWEDVKLDIEDDNPVVTPIP